MEIANDLVIYEVVIKQNLRAFLDISAFVRAKPNSALSIHRHFYASCGGQIPAFRSINAFLFF